MIKAIVFSLLISLQLSCFAAKEDFEGSWESSQGKYHLRMKVRVDQNDFIGFLYNDKGEQFMLSGVIKDDKAVVSIRDINHTLICDAEIVFDNAHLQFKTKSSSKPKDTHIPKETSFTKEY